MRCSRCGHGAPASLHAVVSSAIFKAGGGAQVDAQGSVLRFGDEARAKRYRAAGRPARRSPSTSGFIEGCPGRGLPEKVVVAVERTRAGGAVSKASASQNSATGRVLGSVELHAMIERVVFQTGAGTVHRRGRRGDDVDDRRLRGHQAWTIGRLSLRILCHERVRSPGSASRIAMTRVPTMTLPPPTAMSKSAPAARAARVPCCTAGQVESLSMASKTPAYNVPSWSLTRSSRLVLCATVWPQTTKARGPDDDGLHQPGGGGHPRRHTRRQGIANGAKGMGRQEVHRRSFS